MQNKNIKKSLEWPIVSSIITLAIPILLSNLLQSAYQLTDAFWVWRLWWDAVAAVSVSFPITFLMISLGSGFAIAWTTLIAQYVWAKNQKMVDHVAAQTMLMVTVVSIIIWIIWYAIAPLLLNLMWVSDSVFSDALSFLRLSFIWMIFVFGFSMFQSIMRWLWEVNMPMKIVLWTVLLNLIIDPLFIFGYGIFPAMWVAWAAMATLITQAIASIIWMIVLLKWKYGIHLKISDFKPDYSYIKKAFFLGLPSSIEMSARSLWLVAMTFLITSFGTHAVASYWAWSNIIQLVMIFGLWLSMSTAVLVWQNVWAKNIARATEIAKVSSIISFLVLTFIWIISFIFAPYLISFFIHWDNEILAGWTRFLHIVSLSFWLIWLQMSINWVFRATWNMVTTLVLTLVSQWIFQLPIAFILSKYTSLGVDGLWYAIVITNLIMVFINISLFIKWDWKKTNITKEEKMQEDVFENVAIEEWIKW